MHHGLEVLAVIPARGGSRGLPGKNVRRLAGRPLIAWTIDAALSSPSIDHVVVSTDDPKIASVAEACGVPVARLRPRALATDEARSIDVVRHEVRAAVAEGLTPGLVLLLQPTSPLRTADDVEAALDARRRRGARAVVSVCPAEIHPWHTGQLPDDLSLASFIREEARNVRRQDLPPYYRLNGAIYLADPPYLEACDGFLGPETVAYLMPRARSVDVDDLTDLRLAEVLLEEEARVPAECRR